MNYPIWQLPASGLLIAVVAVLHVFVSHFAVGGGLFLVWTERKARREDDPALLAYVRRHSRFFVLLTLVFGAVSGVGIWFTIALVNPAATASLINAFVWGWAIEWTFFLTEIAAALVYLYGWDRLPPRRHMTVGWIYFIASFLSLVIINGILTFMLTPGRWIQTRAFWDGFFNPTYWPALVIRTLGAIGLAGVYALMTSTWLASPELQRKLTRYATLGWIVPMAVGVPFALAWFFAAAAGAGVPVAEIFNTPTASLRDLLASLGPAKTAGQPVAQRALTTAFLATAATLLLALLALVLRSKVALRIVATAAMLGALLSVGGAEWVREDLRKPFVIGSHMFVNGVRLAPPAGSLAAQRLGHDPFLIEDVTANGVLAVSRWEPAQGRNAAAVPTVQEEVDRGRQIFELTCSQCHTVDGYLAIRPLVARRSSASLERVIENLARWRGRRMPPFAGTAEEKHAVAVYLASLGGGPITPATASGGAATFEKYCSACHGEGSGLPLDVRLRGRDQVEIYSMIGRLPQLNPAMPPFEGTESERHALAAHLFAMRGR